jgi:hypothetical protein
VNEATETIHPVVPNPYTLLSLIPPTARAFTCLDLKDAFFCQRLEEASEPPFAFEWEDPDTGAKGQLTWSREFKNSPIIFGEALARDLENCQLKDCTIFQYVDDILLVGPHPGGLQKWNRRTTPIPTGGRIQSLTKESTDLSRGGHILGISPEPREKKAGNWEKRSDPPVPKPRVLETAPGVSGHCGLLPPMDSWILDHFWATLCGTKGGLPIPTLRDGLY